MVDSRTPRELNLKSPRMLADYIADTAIFEDRISTWESDEQFVRAGGLILRSVDTNIIHLFVKPRERGPDLRNSEGFRTRAGYTQVFRHDPPQFAWAFAEFIASAIFFEAPSLYSDQSVARNLLLLPGIDEEVLPTLTSLIDEVKAAIPRVVNDIRQTDARKALSDLKAIMNTVSDKDLYQQLKVQFPSLFDLFFGVESISALSRRLAKLGREASLTSVRVIDKNYVDLFPPLLIEILEETKSAGFEQLRQQIAKDISNLLPKSKRKTDLRQKSDEESLSFLIAINTLGLPKKMKIVFTTGAWSTFEACRQIYVDGHGTYYGMERAVGRTSVSEMYIRHPMAFWRSPESGQYIAESADMSAHGFENHKWTSWVDTVLPRSLALDDRISPRELEDISARALRKDSGILEVFVKKWEDFALTLVSKQAELMSNFDPDVGLVITRLSSHFKVVYDEFLDSSALLGLVFSSATERHLPARQLPLVIFDCNNVANEAVRALMDSLRSDDKSVGRGTYREAFNKLRSSGDDHYFFFVGIGMLFTSERQYRAAKTFTDRAIEVAHETKSGGKAASEITGREAYYLAAVLARMTVVEYDDFRLAEKYLILAKDKLAADREFNPALGISAVRFDSEEIARDIGKGLFEKFVRRSSNGSRFFELVRRIDRNIFSASYGSDDKMFQKELELRAYVNLFTILLHDDPMRSRLNSDREFYSEWKVRFAKFKESVVDDKSKSIGNSYLHRSVFIVAASIFETHDCMRIFIERDIDIKEHFSDGSIEINAVTIYDRKRFEELRRICYDYLFASPRSV